MSPLPRFLFSHEPVPPICHTSHPPHTSDSICHTSHPPHTSDSSTSGSGRSARGAIQRRRADHHAGGRRGDSALVISHARRDAHARWRALFAHHVLRLTTGAAHRMGRTQNDDHHHSCARNRTNSTWNLNKMMSIMIVGPETKPIGNSQYTTWNVDYRVLPTCAH